MTIRDNQTTGLCM